jgi:hypothetical protein
MQSLPFEIPFIKKHDQNTEYITLPSTDILGLEEPEKHATG